MVGCAKGPAVRTDVAVTDGGFGEELSADALGADGHADGASIIVRARHADEHLFEAEQILMDLVGPDHSALVDIEFSVGTARQVLYMVFPLWEGLQQASGAPRDSDDWDEATELLEWAALDAYKAHQIADGLLKDSPEMDQLADDLKHAFEELADMVTAMGGSIEYY